MKKGSRNGSVKMMLIVWVVTLVPMAAYALGDLHLYAFPGIWAQDLPTTWLTNVQLRYFNYDHVFNASGDRVNSMEVEGFQSINKIAHAERLNEQWQLLNVLVVPIANVNVDEINESASGMGDPISTNLLGWHNLANNLHLSGGFSLSFPLGDYDTDDTLNIGENRWKLYFPFVTLQFRKPAFNGLLMLDLSMNCEWRYENRDTDWDDHDVAEINLIATYWLDRKTMKLGFFLQPDYQFAINESKLNGDGQGDSDFYTFGGALGVVYAFKPNSIFYLKYSKELDGRELNNGGYAPEVEALHFQWAYVF
ncbi:hypothetical protein DESC_40028 [Desulfosarcina cetonica]|uniref:transporter n=1 Tax=Desulfosarcina cetonica TaxID=90730 RepID=UPI0006D1354D|nr:transporter [Desulfosarcina cetonica]VTR65997.1 hypothetical protein DESC_40028 [Desulfosarcina cetonica]